MSIPSREPLFADLLRDPAVDEHLQIAGPIGLFAPHGGGIEPGTAEIAAAIARRAGATLWMLRARRPSGNAALHVTSTAMTPGISKKLDQALSACRVGVAIHGHGRPELATTILVSGRAVRETAAIVAAIRAALGARWPVIDDPARIPDGLKGLSPDNFINRTRDGGVQLELPRGLRENTKSGLAGDALALATAIGDAIARMVRDGLSR